MRCYKYIRNKPNVNMFIKKKLFFFEFFVFCTPRGVLTGGETPSAARAAPRTGNPGAAVDFKAPAVYIMTSATRSTNSLYKRRSSS